MGPEMRFGLRVHLAVRLRGRVIGLALRQLDCEAHVVHPAVDGDGGVPVAQLAKGVEVLPLPRLGAQRAHLRHVPAGVQGGRGAEVQGCSGAGVQWAGGATDGTVLRCTEAQFVQRCSGA